MKKPFLSLIILPMFLFVCNTESQAQVYKYVDEKGITHFTNIPSDPRYKPASGYINQKSPKKHKPSKSKKHSKSTTITKKNRPSGWAPSTGPAHQRVNRILGYWEKHLHFIWWSIWGHMGVRSLVLIYSFVFLDDIGSTRTRCGLWFVRRISSHPSRQII